MRNRFVLAALGGALVVTAAGSPVAFALDKFTATQRHVDLGPGTSSWGGVTVQSNDVVWFGATGLSKRLIVYFLAPGSPDPGPQYNLANHTGALVLPHSEFEKWADLVYSGRMVYVRLQTVTGQVHLAGTYPW